jgi:hypothetical protein
MPEAMLLAEADADGIDYPLENISLEADRSRTFASPVGGF